eukprot:scaffold425_cov373-Pinguiococcus_pyrenoidosus.AAC.8
MVTLGLASVWKRLRYLAAHALGRAGDSHRVPEDHELEASQMQKLRAYVHRRMRREPVQYIVGDWDFHMINLRMRAPVLVPRPETEDLVERILEHLKAQDVKGEALQILDIGSGTGAIGLALLKQLPRATCLGVDINDVAVSLSRENAEHVGVSGRYDCALGDITSCEVEVIEDTHNLKGGRLTLSSSSFDLIVSNPPYIPAKDMSALEPEVASFEDHGALCGGEDGLDVARRIIQLLPELFRECSSHKVARPSAWFELDDSHLTGKDTMFERVVEAESQGKCRLGQAFHDPFGRPRFALVTPGHDR